MTVSFQNTPRIPYQGKIIKKVNALINTIHPDFKDCNPILSGSYMVKLSVAPAADFKDYDFYFESEKDFNKANLLFDSLSRPLSQTENAISYSISGIETPIQLIKTIYGKPESIIKRHDFANSMIAFQNGNIFYSDEFLYAWIKGILLINVSQVPPYEENNYKWLYKVILLTQRISKYIDRYDLKLSESTKHLLKELKAKYIKNITAFENFDYLKVFTIHTEGFSYYQAPLEPVESSENLIDLFNKLLNEATDEDCMS